MGVAILGEVFVGMSLAATPLTFAVASEVLPHKHRLTGQACINGGSALGAVFSLLVGGKLIEANGPEGFRILYYINAGVFAAAAIICFIFYKPPLREAQTTLTLREKLLRGANIYVPYQTAILYQTKSFNVTFLFSIALMAYGVFSPVGAFLCVRFKLIRSLIVTGFTFLLLFNILAATSKLTSRDAFWGYQVILGAGLALVLNGLVTAAQLSAPPEYISITSGLLAGIRALGATVGAALFGAIFHSRISSLLPKYITAAAIAGGLPKSSLPALITDLVADNTEGLAKIPGVTPEIIGEAVVALKEAYLHSFRSAWTAACCFAALGLICSLCFKDPTKDLNNKIDAPAESEKSLYG
ncbi:hypothetical protein LTS07_007724 [Exophiala sideris]|nr:hypothetical protein LTS07_007724 [Exophiala sideris]KAK5032452.1 hypothetical protein LTR13_007275 [Exophiala sideris]KAK5178108.1 hypothetical protein LTR44_009414 [Eurotiomycetes sp. CCFEE 6388]